MLTGSVRIQFYATSIVGCVKYENLEHLVRIKFEIT